MNDNWFDDVIGFDDMDGDEPDDCYETVSERDEARGTSECFGDCVPMCDWCLVSHECPDMCGGGDRCPYVALAAESFDV